jgi:hypothetical protein
MATDRDSAEGWDANTGVVCWERTVARFKDSANALGHRLLV